MRRETLSPESLLDSLIHLFVLQLELPRVCPVALELREASDRPRGDPPCPPRLPRESVERR